MIDRGRLLSAVAAGTLLTAGSSAAWAINGSYTLALLRTEDASSPFARSDEARVEGAVGVVVTAPDGTGLSIPFDSYDGSFYIDQTFATLGNMLDGAGTAGQKTWQLTVDFGGGTTSVYTFEAALADDVSDASFMQTATITFPVNGGFLAKSPASLDWTEPTDAAKAEVVGVDIYSVSTGDDEFFANSAGLGLVLDPVLSEESINIPVDLGPDHYIAEVGYFDSGEGLITSFTHVSGPVIDWSLPADLPGLSYPANSPLVALGSVAWANFTVAPEPTSLGMLGLSGVCAFRRRRRVRDARS